MAAKKSSSTKRFGPRYGGTLKQKLAKIEQEQKKKHKCPSCNSLKVKKLTLGIWECKKCKIKFAAKAYSPKIS